jgi:hypothetical protein
VSLLVLDVALLIASANAMQAAVVAEVSFTSIILGYHLDLNVSLHMTCTQ